MLKDIKLAFVLRTASVQLVEHRGKENKVKFYCNNCKNNIAPMIMTKFLHECKSAVITLTAMIAIIIVSYKRTIGAMK